MSHKPALCTIILFVSLGLFGCGQPGGDNYFIAIEPILKKSTKTWKLLSRDPSSENAQKIKEEIETLKSSHQQVEAECPTKGQGLKKTINSTLELQLEAATTRIELAQLLEKVKSDPQSEGINRARILTLTTQTQEQGKRMQSLTKDLQREIDKL